MIERGGVVFFMFIYLGCKAAVKRLCGQFLFVFSRQSSSWNVLFFGNDEFSLKSLIQLNTQLYSVRNLKRLEVVTSVKTKKNPVHVYAEEQQLKVHCWPITNDVGRFDLGVVVSFGYLIPERIIKTFPRGMINVHASLLPRWRGAAPIIHAIMNGDQETGITIMKIEPKHFDIGDIVLQRKCSIDDTELHSSVYTRLSNLGADCLVEAISQMPTSLDNSRPQPREGITYAPRVTASIASICWVDMSARQVYNLHRAVYGIYNLHSTWWGLPVKLKNINLVSDGSEVNWTVRSPGALVYNKFNKLLLIMCCDSSCVSVDSVIISGKSIRAVDFYNGYLTKRTKDQWILGTADAVS